MPTDTHIAFNLNVDSPIAIQKSCVNNNVFHKHNFLEIAYISKGSAMHYLKDTSAMVHAGDYFAINYNEIHRFATGESNEFEVINILFQPEFISPTLKTCRGFPDIIANAGIKFNYFSLKATPTSVTYHDDDGSILALFNKMYEEYTSKPPQYMELIRCYLMELIIITLRKILKAENEITTTNEILNNILEYVNKRYSENIKLKDISSDLGYSPSYLSTLFSRTVGISFCKYLQNTRIDHACELLASTPKGIDIIATECGYNDIKFFREIFKNSVGMSPSEFRSKSRQKSLL